MRLANLIWLAALASFAAGQEPPQAVWLFADSSASDDLAEVVDVLVPEEALWDVQPVSLLQPPPFVAPSQQYSPQVAEPRRGAEFGARLIGAGMISPQELPLARRSLATSPAINILLGAESRTRLTTDLGDLIGKSPSGVGNDVTVRNPTVTQPASRGAVAAEQVASGSYWVPARIDLDTMLSKIDSRNVQDVIIIKGPYSARHGPDHKFIDFELLPSPRYDGRESHGATSLEYKTNGAQWYGRQTVLLGDRQWGARLSYGHRTGNDYDDGGGVEIPASYQSRDWDLAVGWDFHDDSRLEIHALRLDQSDLELAGQALDINFLVTDGVSVSYVLENQLHFDRLEIDGWYNRTRFAGDNSRPSKQRQFPVFSKFATKARTDVDSMSTGAAAAVTWGQEGCSQVTVGADFRFVKQELNEIASSQMGMGFFDVNSPIPRSTWASPGVFLEEVEPINDWLTVKGGVRGDYVRTEIVDDPAKLALIGSSKSPYSSVMGTDDYDQSFPVWLSYLTANVQLAENWAAQLGAGHSWRPPSLTELYVAQSFMFLLQNGQNTITGDPQLHPERWTQIDFGLTYETHQARAGISLFHAWVHDKITYENVGEFSDMGAVQQVRLKYVNTELATLAGGELYGTWDVNSWLSTFGTLSYVEGRDHSRNGRFATFPAMQGVPSQRSYGEIRGTYGRTGAAEEPLPSIAPLEGRLGLRVHAPQENPTWGVEVSTRIVDNQDRLATSLLETPTAGFTVWDLRSYWQVSETWLWVAGVENFGDRRYQEHLDFRAQFSPGVYRPGVNFYVMSEVRY